MSIVVFETLLKEQGDKARALRLNPAAALQRLEQALLALQTDKPNDRSPVDRHFAVAINDLEHLIGYFKTYIHPNKE